jgi:hypothetical protein
VTGDSGRAGSRGAASRLAGTVAAATDGGAPISMFDYDARPVTPVPVLVGTTASRGAYAIRDFLSRNDLAIAGRGRPVWRPPSTRPPKAFARSWSKRWRRAARSRALGGPGRRQEAARASGT